MEAKLLTLSGLTDEPHFRRLLKFQARRREGLGGSDLEIHTESVRVLMCDDPRLSFTLYRMRIRTADDVLHHAALARDRAPNEGGRWVVEKRYSEFERFRKQLLKRIERWEDAVSEDCTHLKAKDIVKSHGDIRNTFAVVSNSLRRAISPQFPKKRIRVDTAKIIAERVDGLTEFTRKLMGVYTDLGLYLSNNQLHFSAFASSCALLHQMQTEIEKFLEVPQPQKDAERRRQSAVLALENLDVLPQLSLSADDDSAEPVCCICLNEEDPVNTDKTLLVQLPCHHHFHEDCVIDWFSASTTCPLCRRSTSIL
ncbi:E3 ubiquitin-protein ligase Praja-1 [Phytophthora citrophthora]|uniref:E3 ubiquitin-protein ligase Praja-1 n=1 Tax=Phytophthora citrophthora TaxID=4793 RepID=A0AAD9LAL1_9STRA|nr:E3 ubiquitin-protein ligase Praja-1 [Phytophthora citrophthora]